MGKKWLPLESNPEVMGSFAHTCVLAVLALSRRGVESGHLESSSFDDV
jgi:hypothetical protein